MRVWLLASVVAVALSPAAGALAQVTYYSEMSPPAPVAQSVGVFSFSEPPGQVQMAALPDPYVRKLAFLREKLSYLTSKDRGRLSPQHAAELQRELDQLNREAATGRD